MNSVKIKTKPPKNAPRRYHHGDLRHALITAGEEILAERGLEGFSLREAARRAGVSPAAPAHHFGDARGLLTAIAARGFVDLTEVLNEAQVSAKPKKRLEAQALAYVNFALKRAALFSLMWRRDLIDISDASYLAAGRKAFNIFERAASGRDIVEAEAARQPTPSVLAAWALVHGYARLALDGALDPSVPGLTASVLAFMARAERP